MTRRKKKSAKLETPPEITDEQLAQARRALEELNTDITHSSAKKYLCKTMGCERFIANAIVVKLIEEGFEAGEELADQSWFCHPKAETAVGVVQGARRISEMKVVPQSDEGSELALRSTSMAVPGDVVEIRRTFSGWRTGKPLSRPQRRWICRCDEYDPSENLVYFTPISPFAPVEFFVPYGEIPPGTEIYDEAFEIEIAEDAPFSVFAETHLPASSGDLRNIFPAHFVRQVGRRNDPLGEIDIASAQFGVPIDFSPEALAQAEALPDRVEARSLQRRVDLTDLPFVTIDGEDARDFDDAVYCEETEVGWRLLVAIADVSHYVKPGTALDRDAQIRATSVYFPSSVVPMLPEKLSNGLCSLNPGTDRLVMVCDAVISREGKTLAYQFYPGVIHSHARLTYTAVWSALQGEPMGLSVLGPRIAEAKRLESLYRVLSSARSQRGALDFETRESAAEFDSEGHITGFHVRERNDAHRIIEECMLVANVCAADFVLQKGQQTLFRVHGEPEKTRLNELKVLLSACGIKFKAEEGKLAPALAALIEETRGKPFLQTAILRTMQRACYQPDNIGHFGLQYPAYAHFTSPIRRYPDLLLHRTIKGILARRAYVPAVAFDDSEVMTGYHARKLGARPESEKRPAAGQKPQNRTEARRAVWSRLGIICSSAERRADDASRDVMRFLKCQYLESKIGKVYAGVITGMCPAGVFIELEDMPLEGFIHISKLGWGYYEYDSAKQRMYSFDDFTELHVGDRIRAKLDSVEIDSRRINFALEGTDSRRRPQGLPKYYQ